LVPDQPITINISGSSPGASVKFVQASADKTLLQAALRAGLGFPYECSSGGCGTCKFKLLSGDVETLWPEAPGLSDRDKAKGRRLGCQSHALGPVQIDVRFDPNCTPKVLPKRHRVTLRAIKDLTHDLREFQLTGAGPAEFLPGQYMIMELGGHRRCYSMSNLATAAGPASQGPNSKSPNAEGRWDFQIKRMPGGAVTSLLFDLKPGVDLTLDGPYGLAYLRPESTRDVLCMAGGSGLSPMISIVRGIGLDEGRLDPAQRKKRVHFFYGGRTPRDICGEDYLKDLPTYGDNIRFTPVVSDLGAARDGGWTGATGFVHEVAIRALGEKIREMEIYFAGPPPMAEAVQRVLITDLKVPFGQIHYDRFF
jgi:toluene monooxygenase electron transfer component